jgi:hypothetical protein
VPDRLAHRVLAFAAVALIVVLVAVTIGRVTRAWPREAHLSYVEGIWIGLAIDSSQGTLYRPLDGPLGYGGTRYFPLFFSVHGALIRGGINPIVAGYALSAISVALLVASVFVLLRRLHVDAIVASAAAVVMLACQPVQMALLVIRGDALPAACAVLGLAASTSAGSLAPAAVLFTLAFATKSTSIYAAVAAVWFFAVTGRRREAIRLGLMMLAGIAATLTLMEVASGGRALSTIAASAGGGSGLASVLAAPMSFARILRRVPESTFFIQLAAAVLLVRLLRPASVAEAGWLLSLGATLVIYAAPATIENHLVDLTALSVVVVGAMAGSQRSFLGAGAVAAPAVLAALIVGGVAAGASAVWRSGTLDTPDLKSSRQAVLLAIGPAGARMFTDNPMLAASIGASAYLLDPYMFSVRLARNPEALNRLNDDIARQLFDVIVLEHVKFDRAEVETFPGDTFGSFRSIVLEHYRLDAVVEDRNIYRPR